MLTFLFFIFFSNIIFINSICKEGVNNCLECNPLTKLCQKCNDTIYIPNDLGGCDFNKKCDYGRNHCMECNQEKNICSECEKDYFPDENGGCAYTENCIISQNGKCLKCKDGFILIGLEYDDSFKICKSLNSDDLQNCEEIKTSDGTCLICKEGYYLNSIDKKCTKVMNCEESSFGICKKCKKYYYLDKKENKCKDQKEKFAYCKETKNGEKCDICDDGFYFDKYENCVRMAYCEKGAQYGLCKKCLPGYYLTLIKDSCTPEKNCFKGNKDFGICISCTDNYYIDKRDGKCKSNTEDNEFKYCKSAKNVCYECIYGYQIGEDQKCSTSFHCLESINGTCIKCKNNYTMGLDNRCSSSQHCIYSNKYYDVCIECEDNYYYRINNKSCLIAEKNFTNCKSGYTGSSCTECKNDFYLNQTDKLCYSNKQKDKKYYKCAIVDSVNEKCISCVDNYYLGLKDNKCSTVEGCDLSENENKCIKCYEKEYALNVKTGKCEKNDKIEYEEKKIYYKCNIINDEGRACELCLDRYVLNDNGLCVDNIHCIEEKNGICQKCKNDEDQFFCLNNLFGCVETYNEGCLECNNILNFDICTRCLEGYELDHNNQCIKIDED